MSGIHPINHGAGSDAAPSSTQSDATDSSSHKEDFASVLALAWAQPATAQHADASTPGTAVPTNPGTVVSPSTGSPGDGEDSSIGLHPGTSIPDTPTPTIGEIPSATFIPHGTPFPGAGGVGPGTPTKPPNGVKGVKAALADDVAIAPNGAPVKLTPGAIEQSATQASVSTSTPKTAPAGTLTATPISTSSKLHHAAAEQIARLDAPQTPPRHPDRSEAIARLEPTDGKHERREASHEASEADRSRESARTESATRTESAHNGSASSSGNGGSSDGKSSDERARVVDRRDVAGTSVKHATDAEVVADMIAGPRKSGVAINASSLKPLFDGRKDDRSAAAQKVDAAAADGTSLVAGESKSTAPTAMAAAPHAARSTVAQSFETILGDAERLGKRETKHLDIHLSPEELGDVDVRLSKDADGRLSALLMADRETSRHALAGGIDALRQSLERAGVAVDRLDVGVSSNGGSASGANTGGHGGGSGRETPTGPDTDYFRGADTSAVADDDRLLSIRA